MPERNKEARTMDEKYKLIQMDYYWKRKKKKETKTEVEKVNKDEV